MSAINAIIATASDDTFGVAVEVAPGAALKQCTRQSIDIPPPVATHTVRPDTQPFSCADISNIGTSDACLGTVRSIMVTSTICAIRFMF